MSENANLSNGSSSPCEKIYRPSSIAHTSAAENDLRRISSNPSTVLGAYYDARTESIVGKLELNTKIIQKSSQSKRLECEVMKADIFHRKDIFQKIGIDEECWMNSILGVFPSEGMTALVNYSFPNNSNIRFLYYYYSGEEQSISDTQSTVRSSISKDAPTIPATHIISSIKSGIQALIVLELSIDDERNLDPVLESMAKQLYRNQFSILDKDKSAFGKITVTKVFSNIAAITQMTRLLKICQKITEIKQHAVDQRPLEFTLRTIRWYYPNYPKEKARCILLRPDIITMINVYLQRFSEDIEKFNTSFNTQEIDTLKKYFDTIYDTFQQQITSVENIYLSELKRMRGLVINIRNGTFKQEEIAQKLSEHFTKLLVDNLNPLDQPLQYLQKKLKLFRKLDEQKITYMYMQRYSIKENDDLKEFFQKHRITSKSELIYYSHDNDAKSPNSAECKLQYEKWMENRRDYSEVTLIFADFTGTQYPLPEERILFIESTKDEPKERSSSMSESISTVDQDSGNISEQRRPSKSRRQSIPPIAVERNNQTDTTNDQLRSMSSPMASNKPSVPAAAKDITSPQPRPRRSRRATFGDDVHHPSPSENTPTSVEPHNASPSEMVSSSLDSSQTKHSDSDVAASVRSVHSSTALPTSLSEQSQDSSTCSKGKTSSPLCASHTVQPLSKQPEDTIQHTEPQDSSDASSSATKQASAIESGKTGILLAVPKLRGVADKRKPSHNNEQNEMDQPHKRPNSVSSSISVVPRLSYESNETKKNSSKPSRQISKDDTVLTKSPTDSLLPPRPSSAFSDSRMRRRTTLSAIKASNSSETSSPRPTNHTVRIAFDDETSVSSTGHIRSLSETPGTDGIDNPNQSTSEKLLRRKSATVSKGELEYKRTYKESTITSVSPEPDNTKHTAMARDESNHKKSQDILGPSAENSNDKKEETKSSLPATKYINVLLLGESGVGKSTFINALVNYHKFENFEQARSNEPLVAMPVSFLMTVGDDFEEKIVRFGGIDPNEDHDHPGQSVTQCCRSYVFTIGAQTKLRLIDTPGMGDTRGIDQDDLNMQNIISFINNLPHLNAICILLKPNESRLTVVIRSYFTRLLSFLGENARNNIVFCFTNTRSTFFAPGNTGPLLRKMVNSISPKGIPFEKKNTFCFDSEAFRYLVAKQNDIPFDEYQENEYALSWTSSSTTSIQFIKYVSEQLQPYKRSEWRSLEHVQFMIEQLIRPMLESTRNILRNITLLKEKSSKLIIQLRPVPISQPSTICSRCVRTPKRFLDFWILPDNLHTLSDTIDCCSCSRRRHINVSYSLDYELIQCERQQSFKQMQCNIDQLQKAIINFAQFYAYVVDSLKQDDALLAALERIITEEKKIVDEKGRECYNSTLHDIFSSLTDEYKKKRTVCISISLPVDLSGLYELIQSINKIDDVNIQINAIRSYQKKHLQQYEKQVS